VGAAAGAGSSGRRPDLERPDDAELVVIGSSILRGNADTIL